MTMNNDKLSERELNDTLSELGADMQRQAVELEHRTHKLTIDEILIMKCREMYDACEKHPVTNEPARVHASQILGLMNRISDETLLELAKKSRGDAQKPLNDFKRVSARMIEILADRKGLTPYL
jgi:hypothetical protein